MKGKPQIHFWIERVGILENGPPGPGYVGTTVYALNCCRSWDVPANGVFMLFMHEELFGFHKYGEISYPVKHQRPRDLVAAKLEARERALVDFYGRSAKHHLDQIELTPKERRARAAARAAAEEHQF